MIDRKINEKEHKAEKVTSVFKQLMIRKELFKMILERIVNISVTKIQSHIRAFLIRGLIKRSIFVNYLLKARERKAKVIQERFRTHFYVKEFNKILEMEKNNYTLYFLSEILNQKIQLIINVSNNDSKTFDFNFCKARHVYVVYVDKEIIQPDTYLCSFVVDGINICDSRYPTVYSGKSFYNKINFKIINKDDSDESEDDEENLGLDTKSRFFNLKNIEHYRKKIIEDLEEDKKKIGHFNRKGNKKSTTNLSLSNLRKAEAKQAKKLQYVKSMSELLKKEPMKSILRKPGQKKDDLLLEHCDYEEMKKPEIESDVFDMKTNFYGSESIRNTITIPDSGNSCFTSAFGFKSHNKLSKLCLENRSSSIPFETSPNYDKRSRLKKRVYIQENNVEIYELK